MAEACAWQAGFELLVELPLAVLMTGAGEARYSLPLPGRNGTAAFRMLSRQHLVAAPKSTASINITVLAMTQARE